MNSNNMTESVDQKDIDLGFSKIMQLMRNGEFEIALQTCQALIERWPPDVKHHVFGWLAAVHSRMGDKELALDAIETALELEESWAGHWDRCMLLAVELSKFDMAIEAATSLIDLKRRRGSVAFVESAHVYRAYALMQMGRIDEALNDLSTVQDQGPFRIAGRWWLKSELLEETQNRK